MEARRRNRGASRFILAAVIALGTTSVAAPVAHAAEGDCDRTLVHKLVCALVDTRPIEDLLCAVSGELCP